MELLEDRRELRVHKILLEKFDKTGPRASGKLENSSERGLLIAWAFLAAHDAGFVPQ